MNRVKPLRTLVGVRQRQAVRLDESLAQQRRLLGERQAEAADATAQRDDCSARRQQALAGREALLSRPFTPAALKALDFALQELAGQLAKAEQDLVRCDSALRQQEAAVLQVLADKRRNEQRIERFNDRIATALRERDEAAEELADEEAEETAAAKFGLRQRQARESAHRD